MKPSFRTRIISLSVAVSGVVLVIFGVSALGLVYRDGLRKLDLDMAMRVGRTVSVPLNPNQWQWVRGWFGPSFRGRGYAILALDTEGRILAISSEWPTEIAADSIPLPTPDNPRLVRLGPPQETDTPPARPQEPDKNGGRHSGWRFSPVTPPDYSTRHANKSTWRLCSMQSPEVTLVAAADLSPLQAEVIRAGMSLLAALPIALLLIGGGSWLVSRRILLSVEKLADVAESVTASSLDRRVPVEGIEREFGRLVTVLNSMLDRLEASFGQAVRFSADAAHELRTPLMILQGVIEQALHDAPEDSEQQRTCNRLLEEVHRLKAVTQKLLLLSQADSGQLRLSREPVRFPEIVAEAVEDASTLDPSLAVGHSLDAGVQTMADYDLLQQAVANLVGNAFKYNRENGSVHVTLTAENGTARLLVVNTGPGIPQEQHDRLFRRFYRGDPSHGRGVDGVGLGLSLAREIVRAHGGEVSLVESRSDHTVFSLSLPVIGPENADSPAPVPDPGDA